MRGILMSNTARSGGFSLQGLQRGLAIGIDPRGIAFRLQRDRQRWSGCCDRRPPARSCAGRRRQDCCGSLAGIVRGMGHAAPCVATGRNRLHATVTTTAAMPMEQFAMRCNTVSTKRQNQTDQCQIDAAMLRHYARFDICSGIRNALYYILTRVEELTCPYTLSKSLSEQGIATTATIHANLGTAALVEHAHQRRAKASWPRTAPLVVETGKYTGRSVEGQVHRPRCRDRGHDLAGARSTSR